jgi:hypothetical protein
MGADFLLYCCEEPTDYEKAKVIAIQRISVMSGAVLDDIADDVLWQEADNIKEDFEDKSLSLEEKDLYKLDELLSEKVRSMVRASLEEGVSNILGDALLHRRDLTSMKLNGTTWLFTGGMSWGDLPTDSCSILNLIDQAGLFNGMGSLDFDYDSISRVSER